MTKSIIRDVYIQALSSRSYLEPIAGFDDKYLISTEGHVWHAHKEKWQQEASAGEYLKVTLTLGTVRQQLTLHRLVASHFLPNPHDHPIVNHMDGDKHNNTITNLEWVSAVGNAQHALETGLRSGHLAVPVKRELLEVALSADKSIAVLAEEIGRHPVVLSKMLREQAKKDGREDEWKAFTKLSRKRAAQNNLKKVNENSLTPEQVTHLFKRACAGERVIDLAKEVGRHPNTLGALLRKYRDDNDIAVDFRSKGSR